MAPDRPPDKPRKEASVIARLRARLSYANVTATLALFVALGGTGYAAMNLPRNSVGAGQLRRHAVTNSKLAAHAVTGSRVRSDSLTGSQIKEGTLGKVPAAASADHAGSADSASTLGGLSAAQLKDQCPAGTVLYAGSCFETAQRHPSGTDWASANRECAGAGRRLPDAGELLTFGRQTGINFTGFEWTSNTEDNTHMMTADSGGDTFLDQGAMAHPFRCVAPLAN